VAENVKALLLDCLTIFVRFAAKNLSRRPVIAISRLVLSNAVRFIEEQVKILNVKLAARYFMLQKVR
jgi:hypothetical protein